MSYAEGDKQTKQLKLVRMLAAFMALMAALSVLSRAADSLTVAVVSLVSPAPGVLVHKVTGEGNVESGETKHIRLEAGLKIEDVYVKQGDHVEPGDELMSINAELLWESILKCQLEIDKYQMAALEADYEAGKPVDDSLVAEAELKLKRSEEDNAMDSDAIHREMDRLTEDMDTARANIRKAEDKLGEVKEDGFEALIKSAGEAVEEAEKSLVEAEKEQTKALTAAKRAINDAINNMSAVSGDDSDSVKMNYQNAVRRANRDYDDTAAEWKDKIKKAKEKLEEAKSKLKEAEDGGINGLKELEEFDYSVVETAQDSVDAAFRAMEDMERKVEDTISNHRSRMLNASRTVEDAAAEVEKQKKNMESSVRDKEVKAKRLYINKKEAELSMHMKQKELERLKELYNGGNIIRADISGTVGEVKVGSGDETDGSRLMSIIGEEQEMMFKMNTETENTKYMSIGDKVKITLRGNQSSLEGATISSIEPLTGEFSGMSEVCVSLPTDSGMRPGESASLEHEFRTEQYSLTLPLSAVRGSSQDRYVLRTVEKESVLGKETVLMKVPIKVISDDGSKASIEGSLGRTDLIVSGSSKPVGAGDRVRLEGENGES